MAVFAASDFGTSGIIVVIVLIAWAVVVLLAVLGVLCGTQLLRGKSSAAKKTAGGLLLAVSCLVPIFCYFAPPYVVRLEYGNYPLGSYPSHRIKQGMSTCEVMSLLGPPHGASRKAPIKRPGSTGSTGTATTGLPLTSGLTNT